MNLLKITRHKSVSDTTPSCYINVDSIISIDAFREDGSIIKFSGGERHTFQGTPDEIIELMKGLFDDIRISD